MGRGYITGATAPDQARMLAVSHTKPLHDAVVQMADDLYGGYAPATPFSENTKVYRQSEIRTSKRGAYCVLYSLLHCRFQALQCFFFTEKLHYGIQVGGIFSAGYRYSEYSAGIGNRAFVSVGVCLVFLDVGAEA